MNLKDKIIDWLLNYSNIKGFKFVVGISGGIDSAVVSTLCCMTGIETHVISLPIKQKENEITRATNHINWLKSNFKNVVSHEYDLSEFFDKFKSLFSENFLSDLSLANSRSRLRMVILYQISASINGIVVGTGNKVEDFGIGFFTKYGDGGVDISPIADLNKTEVRKLAKELNILSDIIYANSTDGLWEDGRTDEDQIGASYEEIEWAMEFNGNEETLSERQKEVIKIFKKFNQQNQHKFVGIPVFKNI
jgi:NAD+ synthase